MDQGIPAKQRGLRHAPREGTTVRRIERKPERKALFVFAVLIALGSLPLAAQEPGFGVRAGVTVNPEQFHFGGHFETQPLIEHLSFRPNVEFGLGRRLTTVAFNLEFAYYIPVKREPFSLYAGGGPALLVYSFHPESGRGRDTSAEGGFNFLFGVQHERGLFGELKLGAVDSPDLKITIGYAFR